MHILATLIFSVTTAAAGLSVGTLKLDFSTKQLKSRRFESVPREPTDQALLQIFKGNRGEVLRVIERPALETSDADELFKSRIVQMKMLFTPQPVPYSGGVTVDAGCVSQTTLQERITDGKSQRSVLFLLRATDGFVYGTCSKEREKLYSQYLLLYCLRTKSFFEIKAFTDKPKTLTTTPVARCL